MPVPAHKHQIYLRARIGLDRILKDLGEYFYRNKVGFVRRRELIGFVERRKMMVESVPGKGGVAEIGRVKIERVKIRPIVSRLHG